MKNNNVTALEALDKIIDMALEPNGYLNFQNAVDTPYYQIIEKELNEHKQYNDTAEELGIDLKLLPTLLKIKKGDKIYVVDGTLVEAEVTDNSMVNGKLMVFAHYPYKGIMYTPVCYYSEYGKTWALTKEEIKSDKVMHTYTIRVFDKDTEYKSFYYTARTTKPLSEVERIFNEARQKWEDENLTLIENIQKSMEENGIVFSEIDGIDSTLIL